MCVCVPVLCLQFIDVCVCACVRVCVCECACQMCMFSPTEAEELYQRRVLTITGICVALLVVGIVCVVAYCKTKYVSREELFTCKSFQIDSIYC